MKNGIFATVFLFIGVSAMNNVQANCVSETFVKDYCYFGMVPTLNESAISITPKQYGYEASTIVEIKVRELVELVVTCENGPLPIQVFNQVRKDERRILSEERYKALDAISDVKLEYARLRARISNYLCKN